MDGPSFSLLVPGDLGGCFHHQTTRFLLDTDVGKVSVISGSLGAGCVTQRGQLQPCSTILPESGIKGWCRELRYTPLSQLPALDMPLFRKSHVHPFHSLSVPLLTLIVPQNKDDNTSGRNDSRFSGSGADPNFAGYDQRGANNGPGPGYNSSQQSYPSESAYSGPGYSNSHSKPSRLGGKVESAVGTIVGSDTLRAKGMQKERFVCFASRLVSLRLS